MSTLSDTVRFMTIAIWVLAFLWYIRRNRSSGNQSIRLVIALIVLVAVSALVAFAFLSMSQVSGSLTK